ncbi:MAG: hypothetical protein LIP01_05080 [Tannerellaceae bacterium]|nr:hypothetical protein [Tannerellaceae bacterium]
MTENFLPVLIGGLAGLVFSAFTIRLLSSFSWLLPILRDLSLLFLLLI